MCHGFQVGKACPIAQANWYGHGCRDSRHEWHVVRQFQQIGNCQGKQSLGIYGDALMPAVEHLFAPIACESILIKEYTEPPLALPLPVARPALL
jgi:hypothetical protein